MARPLRIEYPGALYHLTSRGDRQEAISVRCWGSRRRSVSRWPHGNSARVYELDGIGLLTPGYTADILIVDAPKESAGKDALAAIECGDVPAINLIVCDGRNVARRGKIRRIPIAPSKYESQLKPRPIISPGSRG